MKIGYLIDCYKDPIVTKRLILRLAEDPDNEIFVHVDSKADMEPFLVQTGRYNNIHYQKNRRRVYWGGLSQVLLCIDMLQEAKKYGCERHVTLHNGCWPLWSNERLRAFFSEDRERIPVVNVSTSPMKTFYKRTWCYHMFEGVDRTRAYLPRTILARTVSVWNRLGIKYRRGYYRTESGERVDIYFSSGHFCITDRARDHLLDLVQREPAILKYFLHCYVPEELFFGTMVRHYAEHSSNRINGAEILDNTQPHSLSSLSETTFFTYLPGRIAEYADPEQEEALRAQGKPFFRKVTDDSMALIDRLEATVI